MEVPILAGIPGGAPSFPVGRRGRKIIQTQQVPNRQQTGIQLADLCCGAPQTDIPNRDKGVHRGDSSTKNYTRTEELDNRFGRVVFRERTGETTWDENKKVGRRVFEPPKYEAERNLLGRARVKGWWKPSTEVLEHGNIRRKRKEPPIPSISRFDYRQKLNDTNPRLKETIGKNKLDHITAGAPGTIHETLTLAKEHAKKQQEAFREVATHMSDNVAPLLSHSLPPFSLELPSGVLESSRSQPPFIYNDIQVSNYVPPSKISLMYPKLQIDTNDASKRHHIRMMRFTTENRPAWH